MKKRILLDLDRREQTALVSKALSSEVRLEILHLLTQRNCNITEISNTLDLPLSSIAKHVRILESAGLILTAERPGVRGSQKVCGISFEDVYLNINPPIADDGLEHFTYTMGIGHYFDAGISAPCGLVSEASYLGTEDNTSAFYASSRVRAQLLWFHTGFIEYRFPIDLDSDFNIVRMLFSVELCSEAPGYDNHWPSDIFLEVNGRSVGFIRSTGDYGGTRGRLNPDWWPNSSTQYGLLHRLEINANGALIDGVKSSDHTLADIAIAPPFLSVKIGVREDAENCGGVNIFGEKFGSYDQGLELVLMAERVAKR